MLVARDDLIRQQTDRHLAEFSGTLQDADVPVMQNVGGKADIDLFHRLTSCANRAQTAARSS